MVRPMVAPVRESVSAEDLPDAAPKRPKRPSPG